MLLLNQNPNAMKKILFIVLIVSPVFSFAQSKTTQEFHEENQDAFVLFAYHNTLRMFLDVEGAKEAGMEELIKDIDKMKLLRVDMTGEKAKSKMQELVGSYKKERFEDLMTMRHEGMKVNVFIKEDEGVTKGIVLLMKDQESVSVIDVVGRVPLNKLASLMSQVDKLPKF